MNNNQVWYPYRQMQHDFAEYEVVHAEKEFIFLKDGNRLIDGVSSWWAAIHGYNHPELNKVINEQVSKFSHIMLGGFTHQPVKQLASKLVEITPEGLNHIFFSDSGSVGVEVALKMAVQFWANKGQSIKNKFISLKGAYHGDTFKTMEVGDDSDYNQSFANVLNKGFYVSPPYNSNDTNKSIHELECILSNNSEKIAAFICEPILQGAAGFKVYGAEFLKIAYKLCKQYNVLFIADEVATGFGRTGKLFACEHARITPDIMVLGKGLTGGYIGHAATIVTSEVFNAFLGDNYETAFMHGPTFMGNPLACAVALKSIEIFDRDDYLLKIKQIEKIFIANFENFKDFRIKEIRILGGFIALEFIDNKVLEGFQSYAIENGVWLRPFGNCLYIAPSYIIEENSLIKLVYVIKEWFNK